MSKQTEERQKRTNEIPSKKVKVKVKVTGSIRRVNTVGYIDTDTIGS